MKTKQNLVATAWMLGGGLLLNAGMVEAQEIAPANEYFAPQRSTPYSPKKSPKLLPEALRNAETSSVARPIDSLNAAHKMSGVPTVPQRASNRTVISPANFQNEPTYQGDANLSPVQRQLEEMYRKDGREMPDMSFRQTPIPANGQIPTANGNTVIRPNVPASNVVPPKPRSFWQKLNPFSHRSAPAPLPNHPSQPVPNTAMRPQAQPSRVTGANGIKPAGVNGQNAFNNAAPRALPTPSVAVPAPQITVQGSGQLSGSLPPVPGDPTYQAPATDSLDTISIPPAPASVDEALENVFSDMPEEKVEIEIESTKIAEPKLIENENPFSGLSLDDEFGPALKPATEKAAIAIEPKPKSASPESQAADENETRSAEIPLPPESQSAEEANEEANAKMKLIAERGELRGLKGFCPVALKDERDLKNALPEFHSTFKGRTYYFSTSDAKAAFDEHPQQYAPISGGQDVVLLKEKVTKEGSLDHAVWYKDRLYLFTSQKTLEQFVAAPKEFAISE